MTEILLIVTLNNQFTTTIYMNMIALQFQRILSTNIDSKAKDSHNAFAVIDSASSINIVK